MDQNHQAMDGFAASAPPPAPGPRHDASVSINIGTHAAPPPPPPCPPTHDCQTNHMLPPATSNISHYNVQYQTQPTYVQPGPVDHCTDYSAASDGGYVSGDYNSYNNSSSSSSASRNDNKTCCIITIIVVVILAIGGIVTVSLVLARRHNAAVNEFNNNINSSSNYNYNNNSHKPKSNSNSNPSKFNKSTSSSYTTPTVTTNFSTDTKSSDDDFVKPNWQETCTKLVTHPDCSDTVKYNEWTSSCKALLNDSSDIEIYLLQRWHVPRKVDDSNKYLKKLHHNCTNRILEKHGRKGYYI